MCVVWEGRRQGLAPSFTQETHKHHKPQHQPNNSYDVLFQDADIVWFKSPWEAFSDPKIDAYLSDDGARSERFAPFFANSGFYYLRSNPMINHFMETVLFGCVCGQAW
jgi:hypothetical protein